MTRTATPPTALASGGIVTRRQTTFWDLAGLAPAALWRVHFLHKEEFFFAQPRFDCVQVLDAHPLLLDYQAPQAWLHVSSKVANAGTALAELHRLATAHFGPWRALTRYLNPGYPADRLLLEGYGVLLRGPAPFLEDALAVLTAQGVRCHLERVPSRVCCVQVLILGTSFVVAERFRFDELHGGA